MIIPCYNVADHVEGALVSVWKQRHADLDVVAVDDGSTDGTLQRLRDLERASGGRLRVIAQANAGASAARNTGLAATQGEWVQFLDADDRLAPGKIERQIGQGVDARADVVIGTYRNLYTTDREAEVIQPLIGDPWEALVRTRMGTTSANLFRREALLAAGSWDESLRSSQDYDLLFRMLRKNARSAWDETLGCDVLKRAQGSISRTNEHANWLRYLDLRCAMRDHLRSLDPVRHAAVIAICDQHLFMAIRVLSKHDQQEAFEVYDRMLPHGVVPEINKATSRSYALLFRLLGFRMAERLAAFFNGMTGR